MTHVDVLSNPTATLAAPQHGDGIKEINVRFFAHVWDDESGLDVQEVDESTFKDLGGCVSYERNTVFDHGCRQICLTTDVIMKDY